LADYFAIPRLAELGGGLQAEMVFLQLVATSDLRERSHLKDLLLDYNKDDLDVLAGVTAELRAISGSLTSSS